LGACVPDQAPHARPDIKGLGVDECCERTYSSILSRVIAEALTPRMTPDGIDFRWRDHLFLPRKIAFMRSSRGIVAIACTPVWPPEYRFLRKPAADRNDGPCQAKRWVREENLTVKNRLCLLNHQRKGG
jgi:hypothetical protein